MRAAMARSGTPSSNVVSLSLCRNTHTRESDGGNRTKDHHATSDRPSMYACSALKCPRAMTTPPPIPLSYINGASRIVVESFPPNAKGEINTSIARSSTERRVHDGIPS
ncbi:hypothetical protein BDN67DRAFT_975211 [Paxillus ammoniavirescens]|nr:hypothetical protein BDN67DRAFT_975211 [Paxillus ammoniavirescens]